MRVEYVCPECGGGFLAPASLEGESAPCPRCRADIAKWPKPTPPLKRVPPPPLPAAPAGAVDFGDPVPDPTPPPRKAKRPGKPPESAERRLGGIATLVIGLVIAGVNLERYTSAVAPDLLDARFERKLEQYARDRDRYALFFVFGCVLVGAGGYVLTTLVPTLELGEKVAALKPVAGKTEAEVRGHLGPPKKTENTESGERLLTWVAPGLRVTLAFRDGVCTRIAREEETEPG